MATLNNRQNGNFTAASTWGVVDNTSLLNSTSNSSSSTTSYVESQSFTPGAITIDAIALFLNGASSASGTLSVRLAQAGVTVAGTEVTINTADLTTNSIGWVLFKLPAPVLLVAATLYTVSVRTSVAGTVSIFRNATAGNWSRFLRTTTTAAPAATDALFITGEFLSAGVNNILTVTGDNTAATVFGEMNINEKGIFDAATTASTNFQMRMQGNVTIRGNSVLQIGTLSTPMPASSTFLFQINQGGVNVNFGIIITANGVFRTYGDAKTNRAFLAADAAIAATSLTTNISTNWLSGEEVVIAPTTATATQVEVRALSAHAVGTTLTVPALTFAHQGTGDFVGEIANITRNIKIQSDSASFTTYFVNSANSVTDLNYTEFTRMGSATANRRGFDVLTTTGSFNVLGCSFHRFNTNAFFLLNQAANNNITIQDSIFYSITNGLSTNQPTGSAWLIDGCWGFTSPFNFANHAGTITNIMSTAGASGITLNATSNTGVTISNLVSHSNSSAGIGISASTLQGMLISNITTWRNLRGISTSGSANLTLNNHISYGNTFSGISVTGSFNLTVENSSYYGSTTILQPAGVVLEATAFNTVFNGCTFGSPTVHATGDVNVSTARAWHDLKFNNCLFGSPNEVANQSQLAQNSFLGSSKHDQTNGVHKGWKRTATLNSDAVILATAPLSVRITPSVSATKTFSAPKGFAIPSGKTATVSVLVRRSVAGDGTAYNGSLPRLWLRQNNSAGITSDVLLATATAASLGAFEALVGAIPAGTDNTVNYIYVDCDGTTGWVNVDKWGLSITDGTANATNISYEDYWQDGLSYLGVNTNLTNNTNQETYWIDGAPVQQLYPVSSIQTGKFFLLFE